MHQAFSFRLLSMSTCLALCLNTSTVVWAQAGGGAVEEVVVTGSNIRGHRDFDTPSPIQTLGLEKIEQLGAGQTQDLFRDLTVNAGSNTSENQNGRQGTSQFSLRGLGVGSTLTLINGRRAGVSPVTTNQGVFFTDVNQYPVNMIRSIEVLTDGASATYGSEAVAGVVNILTRNNFEGFEIGAEARDASNNAESLNMAVGKAFENGHFSTFINYYTQDDNFRGDFNFIQQRSNNNGNGLSTDSQFDSGTGAGRYNLATGTGGTFAMDPTGDFTRTGTTIPDPNCAGSGPGNFVADDNCRYNFIDQRRLLAEEDRLQVFSQFDYDLTDSFGVFSEVSYSANEIRDAIGGAVLRTTTQDGGFLVPAAHPFNYFVSDGPEDIMWDPDNDDFTTNAVDVIVRQRPLTSAFDGNNAADIVREYDNTRTLVGFDLDLSDTWGLDGSYVYARTKYTDIQPRSYNADAYQEAIISGAWNPFGLATADPDAISVKDGFSTSGNSAADLDIFSAHRTFVAETEQSVAEVILSGELPQFIDGTNVSAALGAQYRELEFNDIADSLSEFRLDGRADPVFSIVDAEQDVYAIYGESLISALDDKLEVQLALRYEDYGENEGGDTVDPKVGIKYQAVESLLLRGTWGTSFQAPSIRNTFGSTGSGTLDDRRPTAAAGGIGANCSIEANQRGNFNSAQITEGGDLDPQSAKNYNLGVVFQPLDGLSFRVDYWVYDYTDLIQTGQSFQDILDNECVDDVYTPDTRVVRDPSGQLNSVSTSFINVGEVEAEGFDVGGSYYFDMLGGELAFDANMTYVDKFDINVDGTQVFDGAGNRNRGDGFGSIPDLRANFGVRWQNNRHLAAVTARYIDGYRDHTVTDNTTPSISSQTVWDVQYAVNFAPFNRFGSDSNINLTFGVNNLFDRDPPEVSSDRLAYDPEVHDPRGRILYLRAKYSF